MIGQTLGHYRIIEKIGEGGMGVVYRAEDTTLKRPVALKLVSENPTVRDDRHARFLREARTAAALNHPSICTIYEVGEVQEGGEAPTSESGDPIVAGKSFIAMELVEGETLSASLARTGALPINVLLKTAVQVAEGLAEAHSRRIVHRDLKPQNVMLGPEGRVKILDFGLAKPLGPTDDAAMSAAATQSAELTREGRVLGTAAYMSPEQAQGRRVDARSDVFSFGTMLYQMATGQRPFDGETDINTLAKILEADAPPLAKHVPDVPINLDRIVRRCLQKNPAARYNDTRDLVVDLQELQQEITSGVVRTASGTVVRMAEQK